MGHWADLLTDDVRKLVGPDADPAERAPYVEAAGREIELLAGQTFGPPVRRTVSIAGGLPFAELPGAIAETLEGSQEIWPIRDAVDPHGAHIVQLGNGPEYNQPPMPVGQALALAGPLRGTWADGAWLRVSEHAGPECPLAGLMTRS